MCTISTPCTKECLFTGHQSALFEIRDFFCHPIFITAVVTHGTFSDTFVQIIMSGKVNNLRVICLYNTYSQYAIQMFNYGILI